jgi:hypothetical protein
MAAAGVVDTLFPGPLAVTTTLSGNTNKAQGVFIEMFLTAQLVFTIFMLAAEKHKGTFLAPVGIGLSLFIAELAGTCAQAIDVSLYHGVTGSNPVSRCLLHRWITQPCSQLWSLCRQSILSQ